MSIFASILRMVYKLSGAKKAFALPEDALRKKIEKQNRHRGVFTPTDRKAYYETIAAHNNAQPEPLPQPTCRRMGSFASAYWNSNSKSIIANSFLNLIPAEEELLSSDGSSSFSASIQEVIKS